MDSDSWNQRRAAGVGERAGGAAQWARLLDGLETDCGTCGGTGTTPNERWVEWHRRAGELVAVAQAARRAHELRPAHGAVPVTVPDLPLAGEPAIVTAVERAIDDHMRARPAEPEEDTCPACRGLGRELTAAGRELADLLARHGFVRRTGPGGAGGPD
ncbi:hypothetical protein [Actinomadura sp. B10D3]|uniref:hypothetical protein n=1 Tax=Actinomadura sp. B10D3 TaxID=3153557 RepID=UPI00325E9E3F